MPVTDPTAPPPDAELLDLCARLEALSGPPARAAWIYVPALCQHVRRLLAERDAAVASLAAVRSAAVLAERAACKAKIEEQGRLLKAIFEDTRYDALIHDLAQAIEGRPAP